jgi:hypothetical protein
MFWHIADLPEEWVEMNGETDSECHYQMVTVVCRALYQLVPGMKGVQVHVLPQGALQSSWGDGSEAQEDQKEVCWLRLGC